jgi:hypothetical protein
LPAEVAGGLAQIGWYRRDLRAVEAGRVVAEPGQRLAVLQAIDEDIGRIGAIIEKTAGLAERLGERHRLGVELELALLTGCAEGHERADVAREDDDIAAADVNVVGGPADELIEVDRALLAAPLERDQRPCRMLRTAGARGGVEQPVAGRVDREAGRR